MPSRRDPDRLDRRSREGPPRRAMPSDPLGPEGEPVRLQKVLARAGIASRRHAEDLIRAGRVEVNGEVVQQLGARVHPITDQITVDSIRVSLTERQTYLALNKPAGFVATAHDPQGRPTVMDLVPEVPGLFPVGRLDVASEGLLLLTTDGEWAQRVTHPRYSCSKEYIVEAAGRPRPATLAQLQQPMQIAEDEWTNGALVNVESVAPERTLLRIILREGRNRQIRRMMAVAGHPVLSLVRVRVGAVHLDRLRPGQWRHLTHDEIAGTVSEGGPSHPRRAQGKGSKSGRPVPGWGSGERSRPPDRQPRPVSPSKTKTERARLKRRRGA
jgi:23S rRNA pseudouridine2605 synthase